MFFFKWPPVAILDIQKSLLTISDHYHNFILWIFFTNGCRWPFWMSKTHFRWHFWPFQINTKLFFKLYAPILDVRNSLSIAFLAISDRLAILDVWNLLSIAILALSDRYRKNFRRPFWMSENHFRLHFWPFQIHTDLTYFFLFWQNGRRSPFWMSKSNFWSHFWPFHIDRQLSFFLNFLDKMAAGGHFGWDDNVNYRTRPRYLDE